MTPIAQLSNGQLLAEYIVLSHQLKSAVPTVEAANMDSWRSTLECEILTRRLARVNNGRWEWLKSQ